MKIRRKKFRTYFALCLLFLPFFLFKLNKFYENGGYNPITKLTRFYNLRESRTDEIYFKPHYSVGIYGDLKIVKYLWFDILGAHKTNVFKEENVAFRLIAGRDELSRHDILLLVGNGRSEKNISKLKVLLDDLSGRIKSKTTHFMRASRGFGRRKPTAGLIMIGHELCGNDWIVDYLEEEGGILSFVFVTYNAVEAYKYPKQVHQWPLGVASYRHFPPLTSISVDIEFRRIFFCNFMGTIYPSSSRARLVQELRDPLLGSNNSICFMLTRNEWQPEELINTSKFYQFILKSSDFTLCPVGLNEETYRIYESLSMASIPIIEDHHPTFRSSEHSGLINRCRDHERDLSDSDVDPPLDEDGDANLSYGSFLTRVGSYYYDEASGKVLSLSSLPPNHRINQSGHLLLKKYRAPVLFVRRITRELILNLRSQLDRSDILAWRKLVVGWYQEFRKKMKEHMLDVINGIGKTKRFH